MRLDSVIFGNKALEIPITSAKGITVFLRTSGCGRRTPSSRRAGWQGLSSQDRREYITWLIWVSFAYFVTVGLLLIILRHASDLAPLLIHPLKYRFELTDILGFAASFAVLLTFLMPTMLQLRFAAIASNLLFILYGSFSHVYPVLILHLVLLPINLSRAVCSIEVPFQTQESVE